MGRAIKAAFYACDAGRDSSPFQSQCATKGRSAICPGNSGLWRGSRLPFQLWFRVARPAPTPIRSSVPRLHPLNGGWNGTARLGTGVVTDQIRLMSRPISPIARYPGRDGLPAALTNSPLVATPLAR